MMTIRRIAWLDTFAFAATVFAKRRLFDEAPEHPTDNIQRVEIHLPLDDKQWPNGRALLARITKALTTTDGPPIVVGVCLEKLMPKGRTDWARDQDFARSFLRFHLPIATNPGCAVYASPEADAIPIGVLTFVDVGTHHSAVNEGDVPRYHLIVDVARPTQEALQNAVTGGQTLN